MYPRPISRPVVGPRCFLPLIALAVLAASPSQGADAIYTLNVGDVYRRERAVPLILDGIRDTRTGEIIDVADLAIRLGDAAFVLIGEDHTNMDFHRVQLQTIKALQKAGRSVVIGLEMFPYVEQPHLDRWSAGDLSETEFLEAASWYERWGYPWAYYRDIFLFARENQLPMWGLNAPREAIAQVRKEGWDSLPAEMREHLPPTINTDSDDHLRLFKAYFGDDDTVHGVLSDEAVQAMFEAQVSWDAVMAYNAARARQAHPDSVVVVLAGGGHVAYGLGIARQLIAWDEGRVALVMPVPTGLADGSPLTRVQASYGDYLWGVPPVTEPLFPVLGLATARRDEGLSVLDVERHSTAERAGLQAGDVITHLNGQSISGRGTFSRIMAELTWGEPVTVELQRDGEPLTVSAVLRRRGAHHD